MSLYDKKRMGQLIDPVLVKASDGILFDIQDCGMRHYTLSLRYTKHYRWPSLATEKS